MFAFGTQAWGIASRTMWMQTPSILCLALALLYALRIAESPRWSFALGAVLASDTSSDQRTPCSLLCSPSGCSLYTAAMLARFAVGAAVVVSAFVVANVVLYGQLLQPYFRASRLDITSTAIQALLGNLVSPSRGIFVFVPVTILAALGFRLRAKRGTLTSLDVAVVATLVGHWISVSCFWNWTGGWSYGPRFMADVVPLMMWFFPPILEALALSRNALLIGLATLVIALSVGIQARARVDRTDSDLELGTPVPRPGQGVGLDRPAVPRVISG